VAGRVRDPLVGREILVGAALGVGLALARALVHGIAGHFGLPAALPTGDVDRLVSPGNALAAILAMFGDTTSQALVLLFLIVFLRALLRRGVPAIALFALIVAAVVTLDDLNDLGRLAMMWGILAAAIITVAIARVGLLALVGTLFTGLVLSGLPLTLDAAAWYAGAAALPLLALAVLVAYAARAALAGRSLFYLRLFAD
jgi:hypothetical protein